MRSYVTITRKLNKQSDSYRFIAFVLSVALHATSAQRIALIEISLKPRPHWRLYYSRRKSRRNRRL